MRSTILSMVRVANNRGGEPVYGNSLAIFRMCFGALLLWEVSRYLRFGWITRYFTGHVYYFTYSGFSWVHPWPEHLLYLHFYALGLLALFLLIGILYRPSAFLFCVGFAYIFLLDQSRYLNHFYLVFLLSFLLNILPGHRVWSVDALIWKHFFEHKIHVSTFLRWFFGRAESHMPQQSIPLWCIWILRLQVGIVYLYGGIAKITPDWLRGKPLSNWIADADQLPLIGSYMHERWMGIFLSYSGLAVDLLVVPLLLWRRTRLLGFAIVLAFNLMNAQLFSIGIFPWMMIAATLLFFDPDWPQHVQSLWSNAGVKSIPNFESTQKQFAVSRLVRCFLLTYVAIQLVFPFRHFLYPGTVHWTEEGHNFSWHMKLRSKSGTVTFRVVTPADGKTVLVYPKEFLSGRQVEKMQGRPELIRQSAHYLHDLWDERALGEAEVFVDAFASLNGRKSQRLIDPSVNLASVPWSLWPAKWIVPLQ